MPRTGERGGAQTRERIARVASGLFEEHGFDAVTVADVARAAGVSSVTVFKHFPKKEDLFLDLSEQASEALRGAVRAAADSGGVISSLRALLVAFADERHPFSGTDPRSAAWFRTLAQSPALLARSRQLAYDLQLLLEAELQGSSAFAGDAGLFAAFFIAGYAHVLTGTARALIAGAIDEELVRQHRELLEGLMSGLQHGVAEPPAD